MNVMGPWKETVNFVARKVYDCTVYNLLSEYGRGGGGRVLL
jgi:hypothetical protein